MRKYARRLRSFFVLEQATIVQAQGASEEKKDAAEPMQQIFLNIILNHYRILAGRDEDPSAAIIDSQSKLVLSFNDSTDDQAGRVFKF